jgi:hypothetical protein
MSVKETGLASIARKTPSHNPQKYSTYTRENGPLAPRSCVQLELCAEQQSVRLASGELMSQDAEQLQEREYRRGYRDGWIEALNQLQELVKEDRVGFDQAHTRCYEHWEAALDAWEHGPDASRDALPPRVPRGRQQR